MLKDGERLIIGLSRETSVMANCAPFAFFGKSGGSSNVDAKARVVFGPDLKAEGVHWKPLAEEPARGNHQGILVSSSPGVFYVVAAVVQMRVVHLCDLDRIAQPLCDNKNRRTG